MHFFFSIPKDNISNEVIFADSGPRSCSKIFWYVLYADDIGYTDVGDIIKLVTSR